MKRKDGRGVLRCYNGIGDAGFSLLILPDWDAAVPHPYGDGCRNFVMAASVAEGRSR